MLGVVYVASSAAPGHATGDTVARNYRGTPRRYFKLGHYVRFRIEEVERLLTQRASQTA